MLNCFGKSIIIIISHVFAKLGFREMVILESHGNTQIGAMWPRLSLHDGPLHKLNEAKVFRICKDFLFLAVVVFEAWHTQKYEMH